MNDRITSLQAAIAALLAMGVASAAAHETAAPAGSEKCYGIAKAGQNDCGTSKHDCAALAKADNDPADWKMVPQGTCAKLGGARNPPKSSAGQPPLPRSGQGPDESGAHSVY